MTNNTPLKFVLLIFFIFISMIQVAIAADEYKPYLHNPKVPEHPEIRLFGQYATELFPGAGTYAFPIEVPKGVGGFSPSVIISYNNQNVKGRPDIMGNGWFFHQDYIYRDTRGTSDDTSDDEFIMVLDKIPYQLIYNEQDGQWHTEVEYHFKIEKWTTNNNDHNDYWVVWKKDGTMYRYGYNQDSEVESNSGKDYAVKWNLDMVEDTHTNKIFYSYEENPNSEDYGTSYMSEITYSGKKIEFVYENETRDDYRVTFESGNKVAFSRRLVGINVLADNELVRNYTIDYDYLSHSVSAISKITQYGSDNSEYYDINFEYYPDIYGTYEDNYVSPELFVTADSNKYDLGIRFVDVNNDGFEDIIKDNSEILLNNKSGGWSSSSWSLPTGLDIVASNKDLGIRFADVNKDGFIDIIRGYGSYQIYLNDGTSWSLASSWTFPSLPFVDSNGIGQGVQLLDINNDGYIDLLQAKSGTRKVFLNNKTGWIYDSSWSFPVEISDSYGDNGNRVVDVNGDGLPDILVGTSSAYLNHGDSWELDNTWISPVAFISGSGYDRKDTGVRLVDVNGDGLVDILQQNDYAWINNGAGWYRSDSWKSPIDFVVSDKNGQVRIADVNGDSFADFLISESGNVHTYLRNGSTPYILRKIVNAYDGETEINYTGSAKFDNTENGISQIGFNIFVVDSVLKNNGFFNSTIEYNYSFGKYNYEDSEFRGFGLSTEFFKDSIVSHRFYQDDPRRSKEYETTIYSNDGLMFKNIKEYNYTKFGKSYNLSLLYSEDYIYDSSDSPKIIREDYAYGPFENLEKIEYSGDVSIDGDEKTIEYSYAYNTGTWVVSKPASVTIYDSNGNKISGIKYYYDSLGLNGALLGDLTKTEKWSENGNNIYEYYSYDHFGNLVKKTDANSGTTKYIYEKTGTYPESIINPLGHVSTFSYDLGSGNLLWDKSNDVLNSYLYDSFGRSIGTVRAYDSVNIPTTKTSYNIGNGAAVTSYQKTTAANYDSVSYIYDGFGNLIQVRTHLSEKDIVKNLYYDSKYRVVREDNPYFEDGNSFVYTSPQNDTPYTSYSYDAMDRVVKVTNPDRTTKTIEFDQYSVTDYDENGNRHTYVLDAYGRIVQVKEYNIDAFTGIEDTYITNYDYDVNDNLVKITDHLGNEFKFEYDSFGRKVATDDPDLGLWQYAYDKLGNLVGQVDNKGNVISLEYDSLNRITSKTSDDVNISFDYDKDYIGVLSGVTTKTSILDVMYNYSYDDRYRLVEETKTLGSQSKTFNYLYDSADRRVSKEWDGKERDYYFNDLGKVRKISGILNNAEFTALGTIANRTYNNGIVTKFTYDVQNNRLLEILSSVQNYTYSYDNVGNIMSIHDFLQTRVHNMTYDGLDRLSTVDINDDHYAYSFNAIGNILKMQHNNESKKYIYEGNQSHAPSQIIDGVAGVDVHNPHEIDSGSKNRTYEFFLVNERTSDLTGVNFSVDFGNGNNISSEQFSLSGDALWVIVENNYSTGGAYDVKVSAQSPGTLDSEKVSSRFGLSDAEIAILQSEVSIQTFEFKIQKDISEIVENVNWSCTDGEVGYYLVDMTGDELWTILQHNYSSPGKKKFDCNFTSEDGYTAASVEFTINGLEIQDYDVLGTNISQRVVEFKAYNHYYPLDTNISIKAGNDEFGEVASIDTDSFVMVISEVNYSSDGQNEFEINLESSEENVKYVDSFKTEGASIEDYRRDENVLSFNIRNNWHSGLINWSISGNEHSTGVESGSLLMVLIEDEFASESNVISLTASVGNYIDSLVDSFKVKSIEVEDFEVLDEGEKSTFSLFVKNNEDGQLPISLKLDTDNSIENITGEANVTDSLLVIIEANYSEEGVFGPQVVINSSSFVDSAKEVVVR